MKISFFKIVFALILFASPFIVSAGSGHNISGWAWSSNIGWISFNSTNEIGSINYGVNKDTSGNLVGYAWSSNIGWIKFGGLSGFPNGSGTFPQNAQVVGSQLHGWAKALSADNNGWDGWISLTGANYGVIYNSTTGAFNGYAWGSDVVGWTYFNLSSTPTPPPLPDLTASAVTPTTAVASVPRTYTGTISNIGSAPTSGTINHLFQYDEDSDHNSGVTTGTTQTTTSFPATTGTALVSNSHTFNSPGGKYIRVCADNNVSFVGAVTESNEGNNCGPWALITVTVTPTTPTLSTTTVCGAVTQNSFTSGGNITSDGGSPVTSRGVAWSTSPNPTIALATKTLNGSGTGSFVSNVTGLAPQTTYNIRAYATNAVGTAYGANVTCTTASPSLPDLTASAVTPTTAVASVPRTYTGTISNIGSAGTGSSFFYFFQTSLNGGVTATDLPSNPSATAALSIGGNVSVTSPSVIFTANSTPSVRLCADKRNSAGTGLIAESNEGNNCGPWTPVTVTPFTTEMFGTLTANPNPCTIPIGSGECTTTLSWSINNTESVPSEITANGMTPISLSTPTVGNSYSGSKPYTFTSPSTKIFYLYNNAKSLVPTSPSGAGITVSAACASNSSGWDGTKCGEDNGGSSYNLRVTKTGTGTGTVTSSPGDIDCGDECADTYSPGTIVTLTAVADDDVEFRGFSINCTPIDANQCAVRMNSPRIVYAEFEGDTVTPGGGQCSFPIEHYKCLGETTPNSGTDQYSGPTIWTWTCGTTQCSENKDPIFIED